MKKSMYWVLYFPGANSFGKEALFEELSVAQDFADTMAENGIRAELSIMPFNVEIESRDY